MEEKEMVWESLKDCEKDVKELSIENINLKAELKKSQLEMKFWIKRAEEGGSCDFTDRGICGASANAMIRFATGHDKKPTDYPCDDDDWGRCERTIQTIPLRRWLERLFDLPNFDGWQPFEKQIIVAVTDSLNKLQSIGLGDKKCRYIG